MRNKIYDALVAKHPTVSKFFLGLIANQIAKKVTDEAGIEQGIIDFEALAPIPEIAADFQKENDRQLTAAKKKWEKEKTTPATDETEEEILEEETTTTKPKGRTSKLEKMMESLIGEVQTLKAEKQTQTIAEKLKTHPKLKDIPEAMWAKRIKPAKEDEIDAFADEVSADYDLIVPAGGASRAALGGGGGGGAKPSEQEIKELEKAFK